MIPIIIVTIAIMGISFYAGFVTGWREREEKYWRVLAKAQAMLARAEVEARVKEAGK